MLLSAIYLCTDVEENVCTSYLKISDLITYSDASILLASVAGIFALAFGFRILFKMFNL